MPEILALGDLEFKVSLDYVVRTCFKKKKYKTKNGPGMVSHTYNPSYLGRNQEDCGSRPTWAKS
jgi:hypothetical protein